MMGDYLIAFRHVANGKEVLSRLIVTLFNAPNKHMLKQMEKDISEKIGEWDNNTVTILAITKL